MNTEQPRPLVFDLDGTLIDSRGDIAAACNHALSSFGFPRLETSQISGHVGNGAGALLRGVLSELQIPLPEVDEKALSLRFQEYYLEFPTEHNAIMSGAEAALALRGQRLIALCTNKPARLTEAVLESLGWGSSFDCVVAPAPGDRVKPHPDLLLRVAEKLSVRPAELIMIGDGPQDVGAGLAVGATTIGVKGGFLPLASLVESRPHFLLDTLLELPACLEKTKRS